MFYRGFGKQGKVFYEQNEWFFLGLANNNIDGKSNKTPENMLCFEKYCIHLFGNWGDRLGDVNSCG